jgi:hypothetical protein
VTDDNAFPDEAAEVVSREVRDEPDGSSLSNRLGASVITATASSTRLFGVVIGAGWRRAVSSPIGYIARGATHGALEAAARESEPLRSAVGRWSQDQLTWLSAALVPVILESIDVEAVLEQVDLDTLLESIDVDAVLEQVDLNALLESIDMEALSRRIRIGALVVESTGDVAGSAVIMAQDQALDANEAIRRSIGRIMGRSTEENEDGPAGIE